LDPKSDARAMLKFPKMPVEIDIKTRNNTYTQNFSEIGSSKVQNTRIPRSVNRDS